MIVLRIEKDGRGPFRGSWTHGSWFNMGRYQTRKHPDSKWNCKYIGSDSEHNTYGVHPLCGVSSVNQLLHWFPEKMLKKMEEAGALLVIYKVRKNYTRTDDYQVVFNLKAAEKLLTLKPTEYKVAEQHGVPTC
jgi:hypothetical protein